MTARWLLTCALLMPLCTAILAQAQEQTTEVITDINAIAKTMTELVRANYRARSNGDLDRPISTTELANDLLDSKELIYFNRKYNHFCSDSDLTFPNSNGNKAFVNAVHAAFNPDKKEAFIANVKNELDALYGKIQSQAFTPYHCDHKNVRFNDLVALIKTIYSTGSELQEEILAEAEARKTKIQAERTANKNKNKELCQDSKFKYDDQIAIDKKTGIAWSRCSVGQHWDGQTCAGQATSFMLADALAYAKRQQGWRLPTAKELGSLLDYGCQINENVRYPININEFAFPNTPAAVYWTSNLFDTLKADPGPYTPLYPDGVPILKMNGAIGLDVQAGRFDQYSDKFRGKTALRLIKTAP